MVVQTGQRLLKTWLPLENLDWSLLSLVCTLTLRRSCWDPPLLNPLSISGCGTPGSVLSVFPVSPMCSQGWEPVAEMKTKRSGLEEAYGRTIQVSWHGRSVQSCLWPHWMNTDLNVNYIPVSVIVWIHYTVMFNTLVVFLKTGMSALKRPWNRWFVMCLYSVGGRGRGFL